MIEMLIDFTLTGLFSLLADQQEEICRIVLDKSGQTRQDGL